MSFSWLVDRPRVLSVIAESLEDPALLAAVRDRFCARHVRLGAPRALTPPVPSMTPHVEGSLFVCPGAHRLRAIETTRGSLRLRFPLAGMGLAPLELLGRPGTILVYDVDRDPVAWEATDGWEGRVEDLTVSALVPWVLAPLPSVSPARDWLVLHAGGGFLGWIAFLSFLSAVAETPLPLLLGASYVHYVLYMAALAHGPGLAYREFLRDAIAHKTVSMLALASVYLSSFEAQWPSIAMIVLGTALSNWAALVLGLARTYFGVELGVVAPMRIEAPPYGVIPHPMITGALVALVGVHLLPGVHDTFPWLVPGHLALYLLHLAQEIVLSRRAAV